jgi:hypothetical protein
VTPIKNSTNDPIRQAVASGDFQLAGRLWNGYMARLKEELRRGSLTEAGLQEASELMDWSRLVVLCMRAHIQERVGSLHIAGEYANPSAATPSPRIVQTSL